MALFRVLCFFAMTVANIASAQDYFLAKKETLPSNESETSVVINASRSNEVKAQGWRDDDYYPPKKPCDVNEILNVGDSKSFYIFNKYHDEYMSTDGKNVDLWHNKGSHALWHLKHVEGHTANRFYIVSDDTNTYLSSGGDYNHDNVELWGRARGRNNDYTGHKEIQWLVFAADEITTGAPRCTFYIMHSDSHKWLDTHGDNVHIWGDSSDLFEMGGAPENLQWEFEPSA